MRKIITLTMALVLVAILGISALNVDAVSTLPEYDGPQESDYITWEEQEGAIEAIEESSYTFEVQLQPHMPSIRNPWNEVIVEVPNDFVINRSGGVNKNGVEYEGEDGIEFEKPVYTRGTYYYEVDGTNHARTYYRYISIPIKSIVVNTTVSITIFGDYLDDVEHNDEHMFTATLQNDQDGTDEFGDSNDYREAQSHSYIVENNTRGKVNRITYQNSPYYLGTSDSFGVTVEYQFDGTAPIEDEYTLVLTEYSNPVDMNNITIADYTPGMTQIGDGFNFEWELTETEKENRYATRTVFFDPNIDFFGGSSIRRMNFLGQLFDNGVEESKYTSSVNLNTFQEIIHSNLARFSAIGYDDNGKFNKNNEVEVRNEHIYIKGPDRAITQLELVNEIPAELNISKIIPRTLTGAADEDKYIIVEYDDGTSEEFPLKTTILIDEGKKVVKTTQIEKNFKLNTNTSYTNFFAMIDENFGGDQIMIDGNLNFQFVENEIYGDVCPEGYTQTTEDIDGIENLSCSYDYDITLKVQQDYQYFNANLDEGEDLDYENKASVYTDSYTYYVHDQDLHTSEVTIDNDLTSIGDTKVKQIAIEYVPGSEYSHINLDNLEVVNHDGTISNPDVGEIDILDVKTTGEIEYDNDGNEIPKHNKDYLLVTFENAITVPSGATATIPISFNVENKETYKFTEFAYIYLENEEYEIYSLDRYEEKAVIVQEPFNYNRDNSDDQVLRVSTKYAINPPKLILSNTITDENQLYAPESVDDSGKYNNEISYKATYTNEQIIYNDEEKYSVAIPDPSFYMTLGVYGEVDEESIKISGYFTNEDMTYEIKNRNIYFSFKDKQLPVGESIIVEYDLKLLQGAQTKSYCTHLNDLTNKIPYYHYDSIRTVNNTCAEIAYVNNLEFETVANKDIVPYGGEVEFTTTIYNNSTVNFSYFTDRELMDFIPGIIDEEGRYNEIVLTEYPTLEVYDHVNDREFYYSLRYYSGGNPYWSIQSGNYAITDTYLFDTPDIVRLTTLRLGMEIKIHFKGVIPNNVNAETDHASGEMVYQYLTTDNDNVKQQNIATATSETISFAENELTTIGDFVYLDKDRNEIYEEGKDEPLDGYVIELYDENENFIRRTISNNGGGYRFTDLEPGIYKIRVSEQPGYFLQVDEDYNDITGEFITVDTTNNRVNHDYDIRFMDTKVSGTLFNDSNRNGVYDANELPYQYDAEVYLLDENDNIIDTVTTNASLDLPEEERSTYEFINIPAGRYKVMGSDQYSITSEFGSELQYYYTVQDGYSNQPDYTQYYFLDVELGVDSENNDFGLSLPSQFQGIIFDDLNGDGFMEGDKGMPMEYIYVENALNPNDTKMVRSDENGEYILDVRPGYFILSPGDIDYHKVSYIEYDNDGNILTDNIIDTTTSNSKESKIEEKQLLPGYHIGMEPYGEVSGKYYEDRDRDNKYDEDIDKLVVGQKVYLYDGDRKIAETVTDENGEYIFTEMDLKLDLNVRFEKGLFDTFISPENGIKSLDSLGLEGPYSEIVDAHIYSERASISGKVVTDTDFNGEVSALDQVMSNYEVELYNDKDAYIDTVYTDSNGYYEFNVYPGNYYVSINYGSSIEAERVTPETDSTFKFTEGKSDIFTTRPDDVIENINAGMYSEEDYYVGISGTYYEDKDVNGTLDNSDVALENRTVNLYENGILVDSTSTYSDGTYHFGMVASNNVYEVEFIKEENEKFNLPNSTGKINVGTVGYGATLENVDASVYSDVTLSGRLIEDIDKDGTISSTDVVMQNYKVELYDSNNNLIANAVTNADGYYEFNVEPGTYDVRVEYGMYIETTRVTPETDTTFKFTNGISDKFTLLSGEVKENINAGMYFDKENGLEIEGTYYEDKDVNGSLDSSDVRLEGRTVNLYYDGKLYETTTTDSNGEYAFSGIKPFESYELEFIKEGNEIFKLPTETGTVSLVNLFPADLPYVIDASVYTEEVTLSGKVVEDFDLDGEVSDLDQVMSNYEVELYNDKDVYIDTVYTDSDGYYEFNVQPGNYYVSIIYGSNIEAERVTPETDTTFKFTNGKSDTFTLLSNEVKENINAGMYSEEDYYVGISGTYYEDKDVNGILDATDTLLEGRTVNLYKDGVLFDSTTTYEDGTYRFGMEASNSVYEVEFIKEENETFKLPNSTGKINIGTVGYGVNKENVDASVYEEVIEPVSISGKVVNDIDLSGTINAMDKFKESYELTLYNDKDQNVATAYTNEDGYYEFNVEPGNYYVRINYNSNTEAQRLTPETDTTFKFTNGKSDTFTLKSSEKVEHLNAGMYDLNSSVFLVGRYYEDKNVDGTFNESDAPLEGRTVNLYADGVLIDTTTTDENGFYGFVEFRAYRETEVEFIKEDGETFKLPNSTGKENLGVLLPQTMPYYVDGSIYSPVSISGKVVEDFDLDGEVSERDQVMSNYDVQLYNDKDVYIDTVYTDSDGYYEFNVQPGNYYVSISYGSNIEAERVMPETDTTFKFTNGKSDTFTLLSNEVKENINAGMYSEEDYYVGISGTYYEDKDVNGILDATDTLLEGRTVNLYKDGVLFDSTTTYEDGTYRFGMEASNSIYEVEFIKEENETFKLPNSTGKIDIGTVGYGVNKENVDASVYEEVIEPVSISGKVVNDNDMNGQINATDNMMSNYTVELYDTSNSLVESTTTNNDGYYEFNVEPGTYYVSVEYGSYTEAQRVTPETDTTFKFTNGKSDSFTLLSSEVKENINAGMYSEEDTYVSISGTYYEDKDVNGLLNTTDELLANRTVNLYGNSVLVATTTTDSNGNYTFTEQEPNIEYVVEFIKESTETFKLPSESGTHNLGTLTYGMTIDNVDASVYNPVTLSGRVVNDVDMNGQISEGDNRLVGYEVKLYDSSNTLVAETVTSAKGYYEFNVEPGTYYVSVEYGSYTEAQRVTPETDVTFKFTNGKSDSFTLLSSDVKENINAGMYEEVVEITEDNINIEITNETGQIDGLLEANEDVTYRVTLKNPLDTELKNVPINLNIAEKLSDYGKLSIRDMQLISGADEVQIKNNTITEKWAHDLVTGNLVITTVKANAEFSFEIILGTNEEVPSEIDAVVTTVGNVVEACDGIEDKKCDSVLIESGLDPVDPVDPVDPDYENEVVKIDIVDETGETDGVLEANEDITYEVKLANNYDTPMTNVPVNLNILEKLSSYGELTIEDIILVNGLYTNQTRSNTITDSWAHDMINGKLVLPEVPANFEFVIRVVIGTTDNVPEELNAVITTAGHVLDNCDGVEANKCDSELIESATEPTDPVDPEPTPDPVDPDPTPDPVDPEPTPDPVDPEPTPDPVDPEPTPDPVDPEPTPDPVDPEPTPDPVDPEPTPDPVDPEPTPDPVDPEPTPDPVDPEVEVEVEEKEEQLNETGYNSYILYFVAGITVIAILRNKLQKA